MYFLSDDSVGKKPSFFRRLFGRGNNPKSSEITSSVTNNQNQAVNVEAIEQNFMSSTMKKKIEKSESDVTMQNLFNDPQAYDLYKDFARLESDIDSQMISV